MNKHNYQKLFTDGDLSDCRLILTDDNNSIEMDVHKCVLYASSPYFKAMFKNFKESNSKSVTVRVHDTQTAYDIIKSFYGFKISRDTNWEYYINKILNKKFFGINAKMKLDFKVPSDEFEHFLDKIELIGYNKKTFKAIVNNLPQNYDLCKFPVDLLQGLMSVCSEYNLFVNGRKNVYIWNVLENKYTFKMSKNDKFIFELPNNNNTLIYTDEDKALIYQLNISTNTHEQINFFNGDKQIIPDGDIFHEICTNQIFIVHDNGTISSFDLDTRQIVSTFGTYKNYRDFYCRENNLVIRTINRIIVINILTREKLLDLEHKKNNRRVVFDNCIIIFDKFTMNIWSLEKGTCIYTRKSKNKIKDIIITDNNKCIFIRNKKNTIKILDRTNNYNLMKSFNCENDNFGNVVDVEMANDEIMLVLHSSDIIAKWDITEGQCVGHFNIPIEDDNLLFIQSFYSTENNIFLKIKDILSKNTIQFN
ncbi:BTB/POZ domain-containing protein [Acanthamoeba polyphaga mimivirus]|uniref:BTB/POZ domain-containing protein n=1 Tax=Acanthamoeba polyphaga mimivirus Kroon TaxID=3069720 RepID=A0A0G2Y7N2_9VIRU|nr:BTB/POZ domain-containing protein [Acanthamoeba polyphaga mimivirus]AKI79827.1 BTB/POZ domain-containing protein [Acanthamoeba polyphaga mimivirus Kroon]